MDTVKRLILIGAVGISAISCKQNAKIKEKLFLPPIHTSMPDSQLFSINYMLKKLDRTQITNKKIKVDLMVEKHKWISRHEDWVPELIKQIKEEFSYAQITPEMKIVDKLTPEKYKPAEHIGLSIVRESEFNHYVFETIKRTKDFLRAQQISDDSRNYEGIAFIGLNVGFVKYNTAYKSLAETATHELGHLLGNLDSQDYFNDILPIIITENGKQKISMMTGCSMDEFDRLKDLPTAHFNNIETKIMQNYLEKGIIFEQYQSVGFNGTEYFKAVGKFNNLRIEKITEEKILKEYSIQTPYKNFGVKEIIKKKLK